jgi:hypothetical protein
MWIFAKHGGHVGQGGERRAEHVDLEAGRETLIQIKV